MPFEQILSAVEQYYTERVRSHGPTARGVDWNSAASQRLRFDQLLRVCDGSGPWSIVDYGCGYGALVDHLVERGAAFSYRGFDISAEMIRLARDQHREVARATFVADEGRLEPADYALASGIFNVRLDRPEAEWSRYILHTLDRLDTLGQRGFAFNALTSYSDPERMRPDLHYADPLWLFDRCKRRYSKQVALLHDYPLYEFTILVRK